MVRVYEKMLSDDGDSKNLRQIRGRGLMLRPKEGLQLENEGFGQDRYSIFHFDSRKAEH